MLSLDAYGGRQRLFVTIWATSSCHQPPTIDVRSGSAASNPVTPSRPLILIESRYTWAVVAAVVFSGAVQFVVRNEDDWESVRGSSAVRACEHRYVAARERARVSILSRSIEKSHESSCLEVLHPARTTCEHLVSRIPATSQHIDGDFDEDRFVLTPLHIDERFTRGRASFCGWEEGGRVFDLSEGPCRRYPRWD